MLIGMVVIIAFSAGMHVFLLRKKAIRAYRYEPTYGDKPGENVGEKLLQGGGTVHGEVIAVSFDKFFLRLNDQVQPFAIGGLKMPEVGQTVAVSYAGGRPPTAVEIQPQGASPKPASTP